MLSVNRIITVYLRNTARYRERGPKLNVPTSPERLLFVQQQFWLHCAGCASEYAQVAPHSLLGYEPPIVSARLALRTALVSGFACVWHQLAPPKSCAPDTLARRVNLYRQCRLRRDRSQAKRARTMYFWWLDSAFNRNRDESIETVDCSVVSVDIDRQRLSCIGHRGPP